MNPIALVRNIDYTLQICPTWADRLNRLLWLYSDKQLVKAISPKRHRQISFCYALPVGNFQMTVRDNQGSDAFIFGEVFDHRYYDFPLPSSPKTILDLGANAGFTAIFLARKFPEAELACVEPMPDNIQLLRKNLESNKVEATVFPAAIAVEDGSIQMEIGTLDYGHKVAGITYGTALTGHTLEVEAISVPTLLKKLNWERISLLKVDIEGYEGVLLKENCEWLTRVDAMCIECHEGFGESDLQTLAERWGFAPPQPLPGTWLLTRK
jgi:FkbM family methyltransferase